MIDNVTKLKDDVGGSAVLLHAITDHYGRAGDIDWVSDRVEFDTAVKHGVYDPDANLLIWGNEDLMSLARALDDLHNFLEEHPGADFPTNEDKRDPNDARFWRNRF